jgi:hypothetical protein
MAASSSTRPASSIPCGRSAIDRAALRAGQGCRRRIFAILVVNDLRGMSAQDYAWAMMRQLRVGKLDVGNGAVAVVAPRQHQAAVAFGPGLRQGGGILQARCACCSSWIDSAAWPDCDDADGCKGWTDTLFNVFRLTLSNAAHTKWTIQYQTLGQLLAHYDQGRRRSRIADPAPVGATPPISRSAACMRVSGTDHQPLIRRTGIGQVNARSSMGGALGYTAVSMTTDDGYPVILYVLAAARPR